MQLATVALNRLWAIWVRGSIVSESLRVRLYKAFILPVLCYNCGTWGLTRANIERVEAFHRQQLRKVIGIRHPAIITNRNVYRRTESEPLGVTIMKAKWRLFGHILRLDVTAPSNLAMEAYFLPSESVCWRGRPRITLPVSLHQDLQRIGQSLKTRRDLLQLRELSSDRVLWRNLCAEVLDEYIRYR